jgi:hypothetical protein
MKSVIIQFVLFDQPVEEKVMSGKQKLLMWAVIGLAGWWIFKQPKGAADAVGGFFGGLGDAANSVITFLTALLG